MGYSQKKCSIFQTGTSASLLAGVYEGELTVDELKRQGDFGLGTFDQVDGELIMLDNVVYRAAANGLITQAESTRCIPFAVTTFFEPQQTLELPHLSYDELSMYLDRHLLEKNYIYAIKVTGYFDSVLARSLNRCEPPYRPLMDILPTIQTCFECHDSKGTMIGFRFPAHLSSVNFSSDHFHYIDHEKKMGGHVFEFRARDVIIEWCLYHQLINHLPRTDCFSENAFAARSEQIT